MTKFITICAGWIDLSNKRHPCSKTINLRDATPEEIKIYGKADIVSHGMCNSCFAKQQNDYNKLKRVPRA